jgi:alpha-amylase
MDKQPERRGWVWHSATKAGHFETASNVFDFSTLFTLRDNKANYRSWYGFGLGIGLVGDNTDGHAWRNRAVTFVENHDTGYRTKEDGNPEKDHEHDSFANNWELEQAYAQILTHPGVPTVFWKHYFDWGQDLQDKIRALINARKVAGVHAGSMLHTQSNAQANGVYAARVAGKNGDLYVRIGGDDSKWQPSASNYSNYQEYAAGNGWKVWVGIPGNPPVKQASKNGPLPVPTPVTDPTTISVPDSMLN